MEPPGEEKPADSFNKIDLSALENFTFGTQWSSAGDGKSGGGKGGGSSDRPAAGGPPRRDRRQQARRSGGPEGRGPSEGGEQRPEGQERPDRPHGGPDRPPYQGHGGGGPRREMGGRPGGPQGRGPREGGFGGRDFGGQRRDGPPGDRRLERRGPPGQGGPGGFRGRPVRDEPYISPTLEVTFYPDDTGFSALIKAMRASGRAYELFQIATLLLDKNERFVAVVRRRPEAPDAKPAPLHVSLPDGVPFETEEAAIRHILSRHVGEYFETEEVEVDPPKGNFVFVSRCPVTGELLGPPNYHRYNQILQQHHAQRVSHLHFEGWKSRLETVREPDAVAAWQQKMRKVTRYTSKNEVDGVKPTFTAQEDAVAFLTQKLRDRLVRETVQVRYPGKAIDVLPPGEVRRAVEGALLRQRRFPLDTANALRGRMRREAFVLFKLPGRTVTYVSHTKPKPRRHGQVFSDSITAALSAIEAKPFLSVADLERMFVGDPEGWVEEVIETPVPAAAEAVVAPMAPETPPAPAEPELAPAAEGDSVAPVEAAPAEGSAPEGPSASEGSVAAPVESPESAAVAAQEGAVDPAPVAAEPVPAQAESPAEPEAPSAPAPASREVRRRPALSQEQKKRAILLLNDLRWLVREGYVVETADNRLYAMPMVRPETKPGSAAAEAVAVVEPSSATDVAEMEATAETGHDLSEVGEVPAEGAEGEPSPEADPAGEAPAEQT